MPTLSIIIPVFNKEAYLEDTIRSVLAQTFTDFELLLINDGSTDSSGDICGQLAKSDSRIVVVNQNNQGVSAARNTGLQLSRGNYIGFADADDTLEPDMYAFLIGNLISHNADISICGVRKIFPSKVESYYGTGETKIYETDGGISALLNKNFSRSVYEKIFRADLVKSIRFEGRMNEDTFFNFNALSAARKTVFQDIIKYNYIIRDNSVSMSKFSQKYMDTLHVSEKMVGICEKLSPALANDARYFDLIANISILNTILLSKKEDHLLYYKQVISKIKTYSNLSSTYQIRTKHRYAMLLIQWNPDFYAILMRLYCRLSKADVYNKA